MSTPSWRRWSLPFLAVAALAVAQPAAAQEFLEGFALPRSTWALFAGATHDSDVQRTINGSGDTIVAAGAAGAFYKDQGRLRANLRAAAEYQDYVDHTFHSDVLGTVSGAAQYAFIPERFSWQAQDSYGQIATNTFQAATPNNRTNTNVFSTGPDLVLAFDPATGLRLGARYGGTHYDTGSIDDTRYGGSLGLYHRLSPAATVSLNAGAQRVEFRSLRGADYNTQDYFARLETRRARYTLSLDAGAGRLHTASRDESTPLLHLNFYRRLTASWNLNLGAASEYRSSGDLLNQVLGSARIVNGVVVYGPGVPIAGLNGTLAGASSAALTNQPARYESLRAALDFARTRTTLGVSASIGRERYPLAGQSLGLDRKDWSAGASASRLLRPTLRIEARADYTKRKFEQLNESDSDTLAALALAWNLSARLAASLGFRYDERRSEVASAFVYTSKAAYLGFTYGPRDRAVPAASPGLPLGQGGAAYPTSAAPRTP